MICTVPSGCCLPTSRVRVGGVCSTSPSPVPVPVGVVVVGCGAVLVEVGDQVGGQLGQLIGAGGGGVGEQRVLADVAIRRAHVLGQFREELPDHLHVLRTDRPGGVGGGDLG